MKTKIPLRAINTTKLSLYTSTQLNNLFPAESIENDLEKIHLVINVTIERMYPIIMGCRTFNDKIFDHFNSMQYSIFLHILSNEYWKLNRDTEFSERLFYLNRALNAIELFYSVEMPEIFLLAHTVGTVLANTSYGNRLAVFQNVTVGRVGNKKPVILDNVVLFPGAVISGSSTIGNNCVVGAGVVLHNFDLPDNTIALRNADGFILKPRKHNFSSLYFEYNNP